MRVVISGYYGFGNAGDEAVLDGIVKLLNANGVDDIYVLTSNCEYTKKHHPSVKTIKRYSILKIIKTLKTADLFISGGGSLLQNVTSNKSLYYYLLIIYLAKRFCKKSVIFAQGIGPIYGAMHLKHTMETISALSYISVRDVDSYNLLSNLFINSELTGDPAYVSGLDLDSANKILEKYNLIDKPFICLSLRNYKHNTWLKELEEVLFDIGSKVDVPILNIPFQYPDDKIYVDSVNVINVIEELDFRTLKAIISLSDMVIGMRLHSLIFAASLKIPFLTLSYDPKTMSHANKYGLYYSDVNSIERTTFIQKFCEIYNDREYISKNMKLVSDKQVKMLNDSISKVL